MIVLFRHAGEGYEFNANTRLIKGSAKTVPLMNASEDLRNAAVSAKVALLRHRAREQFNPLSLQRINDDEATTKQSDKRTDPTTEALIAGF